MVGDIYAARGGVGGGNLGRQQQIPGQFGDETPGLPGFPAQEQQNIGDLMSWQVG
jgi:hypothetical protein